MTQPVVAASRAQARYADRADTQPSGRPGAMPHGSAPEIVLVGASAAAPIGTMTA